MSISTTRIVARNRTVIDFSGMNSYYKCMKSTVSEKGQVTIPKAVRDRLGLQAGTVIEFAAERGRLVGRKADTTDPFVKWRGRGRLPGNESVDAYLERVRNADRG